MERRLFVYDVVVNGPKGIEEGHECAVYWSPAWDGASEKVAEVKAIELSVETGQHYVGISATLRGEYPSPAAEQIAA